VDRIRGLKGEKKNASPAFKWEIPGFYSLLSTVLSGKGDLDKHSKIRKAPDRAAPIRSHFWWGERPRLPLIGRLSPRYSKASPHARPCERLGLLWGQHRVDPNCGGKENGKCRLRFQGPRLSHFSPLPAQFFSLYLCSLNGGRRSTPFATASTLFRRNTLCGIFRPRQRIPAGNMGLRVSGRKSLEFINAADPTGQ
jgi:hypothetical protein